MRPASSRRVRRLIVVAPLALLWLGCIGIRVETDHDPSVDFVGLESFSWLDPPLRESSSDPTAGPADPFVHNSLLDKRVRDTVERVLGERGYRSAEDDADFQLRYQVVSRQVTQDSPVFIGGGGHSRVHHGQVAYGGSRTYQEGTLVLDVIDPDSERIAWRGWASARTRDGHIDADRLTRTVRAILEKFPPPARDVQDGG